MDETRMDCDQVEGVWMKMRDVRMEMKRIEEGVRMKMKDAVKRKV